MAKLEEHGNKEISGKDIDRRSQKISEKDIERQNQIIREKRMADRDERRAIRRERRIRQVRMYKMCMAAVIICIVCGTGAALVLNMTSFKLSRKLSKGDKYTESGDYAKANEFYEEAIKIDSGTVEAYRCMAQNDLEQDDSAAAKEILYKGWENTQDESLLHYYCTVILNEAVAEINERKWDLGTVDKCIQVLQTEAGNEDALSLLDTCYELLYTGDDTENTCELFAHKNIAGKDAGTDNADAGNADNNTNINKDGASDICQYENYERQLRSLLDLYKGNASKELGNIIVKYAIIDMEYVHLSMSHLSSYHKLLADICEVMPAQAVEELMTCLSYAIEIEADFNNIFKELAQGNYESAKEFIVSDTYVQLRDAFINNNSGYWEGEASVPVNQEQMVIHQTDGGCRFFWLDYNEYDNPQGVITVWGSRQLDDGVQRTTISYEPAGQNGEYYPHTEYVISYEYSNVLKNGTDVKMNYRFNTVITTEEGTQTEAVGDWGGENEWRTSY